jgi:hypothetical protein
MPKVLMWSDDGGILQRIYDEYIRLLSDSLGETLGGIVKNDPAFGESLVAEVREASDSAFLRVLIAPETSYRLLWRKAHSLRETGVFLAQSFRAEAAREGRPIVFKEETWTSLGDMGFLPDGKICRFPSIDGLMPLDFGSPHALRLNLEGIEEMAAQPRSGFEREEIELVLSRLRQAQKGIASTALSVLNFVIQFTKVLVLMKDTAAPQKFASGSNGQCVGRSFLVNPHALNIDEVDLADAIVHETIHSLLYMQERKKRWVYDPELYDPISRAVSPWTGNSLALRPFLQACFVWYGLLQFWCLALPRSTFNPTRVRERMIMALKGFLGRPLLEQVAPYKTDISPDLLEAIEEMQAIVISAYNSLV